MLLRRVASLWYSIATHHFNGSDAAVRDPQRMHLSILVLSRAPDDYWERKKGQGCTNNNNNGADSAIADCMVGHKRRLLKLDSDVDEGAFSW